MNFESYTSYLLSLNISQISREFGFKKIGMNSLYLITHLTRAFIEKISIETKESAEETNRSECNLIDLLFTLNDNVFSQEELQKYIKESKIKYEFSKGSFIRRINNTEEKERYAHINKINSSHITNNTSIKKEIIDAIPPQLRFFPKEFSQNSTIVGNEQSKNSLVINISDDKKVRHDSIVSEKKTIEEINNTANYFDFSKKHNKKKNDIDINRIINDIIIDEEELILGKKRKREEQNDLITLGVGNLTSNNIIK